MTSSRTFIAVVCVLGLLCAHGNSAAEQEVSQGLILVQRTIDTKYERSPDALPSLLRSTLTLPYLVKQHDTLQKIVSDKYAMGPTGTPDLYEQIAARIQSLNDLPDRNTVREGSTLALPDIPPLQWKEPIPGNPYYGMPRVQVGRSYEDVLSGKRPTATDAGGWGQIFDQGRKAEPLVNQWLWLTVEQARAEELALGTSAFPSVYWAQPLTLKFAAQAEPASEAAGAVAADVQHLSALIKRRPPSQDVVLYVLDDSWPSTEAFEASRLFFVSALKAIRKANFIPPGRLPSAVSAGGVTTDFPTFEPPRILHAARIAKSLADFTKLTPRVKVVYLPLFTQQKWSRELWEELTYTARVATDLRSRLGDIEPTPEILSRARSDAALLVGQIPSKIIDSLGQAQQTPITVLQKIAQLYAMTTGVPYFISMSWTVEKREVDFGPDPDSLGVSLAASGNDKKEVLGDAVYLAYRAKAAPGDVLAVMNTDSSGAELCGSSKLPLTSPNAFYGFAYDGTFDGGLECGSSFSTPRVAWLLALRQAYNSPVSRTTWPDWYGSYRTSMLSLQSSTQQTSRRYWLPVRRLFDGL